MAVIGQGIFLAAGHRLFLPPFIALFFPCAFQIYNLMRAFGNYASRPYPFGALSPLPIFISLVPGELPNAFSYDKIRRP
jgi:hypothetical protein